MVTEEVYCYEFGNCRLYIENHKLLKKGKPIFLSQKTFEILCYLVQNQGKVLKKEDLLNKFWEEEYKEESNIVQQIYRIRKALKDNDNGENYIETIPKYGYRFTAEVNEISNISQITENNLSRNQEINVKNIGLNNETVKISDISLNEFAANSNRFHQNFNNNGTDITEWQKKSYVNIPLSIIGLACFAALITFGYIYYPSDSNKDLSDIKSIAVLPFEQIGNPQNEKLGLGLADSLISNFSNQKEISVLPTSSILKYVDGKNISPLEIGQKLNVDAVLTGTIQRDNEKVRINAQLINIKDESPIWVSKFDANYSDIFSLQDKISDELVSKIPLLANKKRNTSPNNYTKNIESYQAYTMGLFHWNKRSENGLIKAIEYFQKAIDKDSNFALAYAYLADSYILLGRYGWGKLSIDKIKEKGQKAAEKALELEPNNSEALSALAVLYIGNNHRKKAYNFLKKAIEEKPNNSNARRRISWMYANSNNLTKALEEATTAQNLDPQSVFTNSVLAMYLNLARRPDEAKLYANRAIEVDPTSDWGKWRCAKALEQKGLYDKALEQYLELEETNKKVSAFSLDIVHIYIKKNENEKARVTLQKILKKHPNSINPYETAVAYTLLGEEDEAIKWLSKTININADEYYALILYDYDLDSIRKNPEFISLIKKQNDIFAL